MGGEVGERINGLIDEACRSRPTDDVGCRRKDGKRELWPRSINWVFHHGG